jgi:7SK snRNA methylphosphate capping enzyme
MESKNPYLAHRLEQGPLHSGRKQVIHVPKKPQRSVQLHSKKSHTIHGNYSSYYGYRNLDSRINDFQKNWFCGKRVLDIGCNAGNVTLEIAHKFDPEYIEGVDIDPLLVKKARRNQSVYRSKVFDKDLDYFPISCYQQFGRMPPTYRFSNVHFRAGDFVHEPDPDSDMDRFDTILALSITKWIHLNNGDGGLRFFFNKVYRYLHKGGLFVLEPQPLEGYRKRAGMTPQMRDNFAEMEFYPKDFLKFLTSKVGFRLMETVEPKAHDGFSSRIIYILQKS